MKYYEVKDNYNIKSHMSKVDDSFVDYYVDSDKYNFIIYFDKSLFQAPSNIKDWEHNESMKNKAKAA